MNVVPYRTPTEAAMPHPAGWARLGPGASITRLPLVDVDTGLFARLVYRDAELAAARIGGRLPTREEVHELVRVGHLITPTTLSSGPEMVTREHARTHDDAVRRKLDETHWDGKRPVMNAGKHWAFGATGENVRICGWWFQGRMIQAGLGDNPHHLGAARSHHDYGTTTMVVVDGDTDPPPTERMMGPRFIPDRITPATPGEMLAALGRAAPDLGRASLLTLLAQWSLETGAGRSMHCFNVGNIKGKPDGGDGRSWTFFRCNEIIGGKEVWFDPPHPGCCFRAYDTLDEGAADYLATLRKRFASAWPAVEAGDPAAFAHLLKVAHYYTASEAGYTRALELLFRQLDDATLDVPAALAELGFCDGDVRAFQAAHHLVVDGIVGPKTRAALAAALAAARP